VHLDPRQRVVTKNLPSRLCEGRIIKRPDIENNPTGTRSWLLGDRRAAFGAEVPEDWITAAADATERFEGALDGQRLFGHSNQRGKGAPGEFLAIPAMAHRCARRIGLGCVPHSAAEAPAFDHHLDPLALLPFRLKARLDLLFNFRPRVMSIVPFDFFERPIEHRCGHVTLFIPIPVF
jgi:hypothetical protein